VPAGPVNERRPRSTSSSATDGRRSRPRLLSAARSRRPSASLSSVITPELPPQPVAPDGETLSRRVKITGRLARPGKLDGVAEAHPARSWRVSAMSVLRQHWPAVVLLIAGAVLRVITQMAYHPAILYVDSLKYLYDAWLGSDPLGYKALLNSVLAVGDLGTVVAVQHLLGLAMAVALYALLMRKGVNRWLAALAIAPVLLDSYQLQAEEMIMPDVFFEALVVLALVILLWKPIASWRAVIVSGLILGTAVTVHEFGLILIVPVVLYLLVNKEPGFENVQWSRAILRGGAVCAAFAVPIFIYCSAIYAVTGHFQLSAGRKLTPRLAQIADCATLRLPPAARPLCPTPAEQRQSSDWFQHDPHSPLLTIPQTGQARLALYRAFDKAVEHQQPERIVAGVLADAVRLYQVDRVDSQSITPISRWQFQTTYPTLLPNVYVRQNGDIVLGVQYRLPGPINYQVLKPVYGGKAQVDRSLAGFLRAYQLHGGYAPGPLLLIFTLAGLAGSLLALVSRRSSERGRKLALACLVFFLGAVGILLISDIYVFSWRYQIQALTTLPPAGVLGASAALEALRLRKPAEMTEPASRQKVR
jgi:Dolichyl-phosphate-mannose-protein mannosyltransferase